MSRRMSFVLLLVLAMMSGCLGAIDDEQAIDQTLDMWQNSFRTNEKDFLATMTDLVQMSALDDELLDVVYIGTKQSFAIWFAQIGPDQIRLEDREVTRTGKEAVVNTRFHWSREDEEGEDEFLFRMVKQGNKWLIRELVVLDAMGKA